MTSFRVVAEGGDSTQRRLPRLPSTDPLPTWAGPSRCSGGLLRAAGFDADILQNTVLVTEGKDRVVSALKELAEGRSKVRMFDVLFCEGCINGPRMPGHHGRRGAKGECH